MSLRTVDISLALLAIATCIGHRGRTICGFEQPQQYPASPVGSGEASRDRPSSANRPHTIGRRSERSRKALALVLVFPIALLAEKSAPLAQATQSISIFGDGVPNNPVEADFSAVTLGLKFWSSQPGTVSGIRFYRGAFSPQGYVARLYTAGGTLLGSVTMTQESGPVPGWQQVYFATPISISANQTYIAAYYAPTGLYADVYYGLTKGLTNGALTVPASATVGGNGVYNYGNAFPSKTWEDSNYFVDVVFAPTAPTPYLVITFNPSNPSISSSAPLGSIVATITASWSDSSPFTGTLSFAPPYSNDQGTFAISGNTLIVNPAGPGVSADANTIQQVTIVATQ